MEKPTNKQTVTTLKHYKRENQNSREKGLVTEHVVKGSPTFEFLDRMSIRRRKQECVMNLDLRGKVPYDCKPVNYRDRQFWLDDISSETFTQGLKDNNGVFTVGMFEDMLNAPHTFRGMQTRKEAEQAQRKAQAQSAESTVDQTEASDDLQSFRTDSEAPEIIPLGYFERRHQARVQHVIETLVTGDQQTIPLKTRDLSSQGIQVCARHPLPFVSGEQVLVDFPSLNPEYGEVLMQVSYRVLRIEQHHEEYRMSLICGEGQQAAQTALDNFVDSVISGAGRRKLDTQDRRITATSMMTELHYILSSSTVPIFICSDPEAGNAIKLCAVGSNENNREKLKLFSLVNHEHVFAHLSDPERIRRLHEQAQESGQTDPLMAVYRENHDLPPQILFDFELADIRAWKQFVNDYSASHKQFNVFKVVLRPVSMPESMKILHRLERLSEKSTEHAEDVIRLARNIVSMGVLVDVSREVLQWSNDGTPADNQVANEYIKIIKSIEEKTGPEPRIIRFGYIEHRHEDRYIVALEAELGIKDSTYTGSTHDISINGMSIKLQQAIPAGLNRGDIVRIGLPALAKRTRTPDLMKIPYEVCGMEKGSGNLISLKRLDTAGRAYADFFKDLIKRNRQRIQIDMEDTVNAGVSRLFASLAVENSATIPLLVYKDLEEMITYTRIALPDHRSTFVQFFETAPKHYDFSPLNVSRRLAELSTHLRKGEDAVMTVYMFKKPDRNQHQFEILSATDSEFESDSDRKQFFDEAMQHDHCAVKIRVDKALTPERIEVNATIERLYECSPHQTNKLLQEFNQLYAVGDVIDVTQQVMGYELLGAIA